MDLTAVPAPLLERLAETLWAERLATERLLHRLTTTRLLLAAEEERFLPRAVDEAEAAAARLDAIERRRRDAVHAVAVAAGGHDAELRLRDLVAQTSGPWPQVFDDLRTALVALATDVGATAAAARALAGAALARPPRSLATPAAPAPTRGGAVVVLDRAASAVDLHLHRAAHRAALARLDRSTPTSLRRFLR